RGNAISNGRVNYPGDIAIRRRQCLYGVDRAVSTIYDIGLIDHIKDREPRSATVNGILQAAEAVLVLNVIAFEHQPNIGFTAQIKIRSEEILDLVASASIRLRINAFASDDSRIVDPVRAE